mmetsp:Transcript_151806/g.485202  ORF Transcript_151806/g.485202 Transcript_151806/m.485202 type:complete len:247 (-) Transcript_151806:247-987(-)
MLFRQSYADRSELELPALYTKYQTAQKRKHFWLLTQAQRPPRSLHIERVMNVGSGRELASGMRRKTSDPSSKHATSCARGDWHGGPKVGTAEAGPEAALCPLRFVFLILTRPDPCSAWQPPDPLLKGGGARVGRRVARSESSPQDSLPRVWLSDSVGESESFSKRRLSSKSDVVSTYICTPSNIRTPSTALSAAAEPWMHEVELLLASTDKVELLLSSIDMMPVALSRSKFLFLILMPPERLGRTA